MSNLDKSNLETWKRLFAYTRKYRIFMILALFFGGTSVTFSLLTPVLIGKAIDHILGPQKVSFDEVGKILGYLGVIVVGSGIFQWGMSLCTNKITYGTVRELRREVFGQLNKVPLSYIDTKGHGDLIHTVVNDIDIISDGLLQGFAQLFTGIITILGTILFMLSIHVVIGLCVIFLTPLSLFVAAFISRRTYKQFKKQSEIKGEMSGFIEEMIGNQKLVKTFSYEDKAIDKFKEINHRLYDCGFLAQFYSSITNPGTRFVNGVVYGVVGILGAFFGIKGTISVGQLSSFLAYANQYTKPFNEISGVVTELQASIASAKRVFSILDAQKEPEEGREDIPGLHGSIQWRDVYFSYDKEESFIESLNLDVISGQKIAIVGPTGCGKTTLINLLMGFYTLDKGTIRIDGEDIEKLKLSTLRSLFGMVLQESWLFHGTIGENISYGKPDASQEEIIAAAKAAYAHSFIRRLPKGYDTMINEEGENISQGEKQLLCIARVMLTKPSILVLDEATSNIDTRTEIKIQKAFDQLMEGRTSFVVAHRLSTIREADMILVMNEGKVMEKGNHETLLEKGGFYHNLYYSQFAIVE